MGLSIQELYLSKVLARFVRYFAAECLPKRALCVPLIARGRRFRPHSDPVSRGIPLEAGLAWRIGAQKRLVICVGSRVKVMRKHLLSIVIVGFLLLAGSPARATQPATDPTTQAPVAVQRVAVPSRGLPDEAAMVLIGAALIALAAAVRRVA